MNKGTKVLLINGKPNEDGTIRIRPLEGEISKKHWHLKPRMIEFCDIVDNKDSKG